MKSVSPLQRPSLRQESKWKFFQVWFKTNDKTVFSLGLMIIALEIETQSFETLQKATVRKEDPSI